MKKSIQRKIIGFAVGAIIDELFKVHPPKEKITHAKFLHDKVEPHRSIIDIPYEDITDQKQIKK